MESNSENLLVNVPKSVAFSQLVPDEKGKPITFFILESLTEKQFLVFVFSTFL